jgi:hypothetical protein
MMPRHNSRIMGLIFIRAYILGSYMSVSRLFLFVREHQITLMKLKSRGNKYPMSVSHITTDDQSVSASWFRAPSGAHDQMLIQVSHAYISNLYIYIYKKAKPADFVCVFVCC